MQFRKKPVVIEAIQYNGDNFEELVEFTKATIKQNISIGSSEDGEGYLQQYTRLEIPTLEGNHLVVKWDWIIKGIKGEFYPCKPDIFEATYDKVSETE